MARHKIPERSFIFEMPDGREIVGYPLTIGHERAFLRDGTYAAISNPERPGVELYDATMRYLAAAFRKDEAFVEQNFTPAQAGEVLKVLLLENFPKVEGSVGPEAASH